jgi:mRNA interferase MazF
MRRGDVYLVNLDPVVGAEAATTRPAIVVSNDIANQTAVRRGRGVVTVVPVTSNVERIYSFQVGLPPGGTGLAVASKAQAEQVRSVDVARLSRRLGALSPDLLGRLEAAVRLHLTL